MRGHQIQILQQNVRKERKGVMIPMLKREEFKEVAKSRQLKPRWRKPISGSHLLRPCIALYSLSAPSVLP